MGNSSAMRLLLVIAGLGLSWCSVPADEVKSLPGLDKLTSRLHSGYIKGQVGNQTFYTHYILTAARTQPETAPLVLWQQGGPGSSGMAFGWLAELGPYTVNAASLHPNNSSIPPTVFHNPNSFDQEANVLILEHPPGTGFSYCTDESGAIVPCVWNDQTQAEAFEVSLTAFYSLWPEFGSRDLYAIGESYAGLLLPFLVDRLIDSPQSVPSRQLRALAIGNGCPGTAGSTPDKRGTCNGPYGDYDTQHVFELIAGHGGISQSLQDQVSAACGFPCRAPTWSEDCMSFNSSCNEALAQVDKQTGPFDIYNYYDNCGNGNSELSWSQHMEAGAQPNPTLATPIRRTFTKPAHGGESYMCGTGVAAVTWANREDVRQALHMKPQSFYGRPWSTQAGAGMRYTTYTGSSYDLYPKILQHVRTTIYNGDVDACVPYNSNEEWVNALATQQHFPVVEQWRPWVSGGVPAGYVTTYGVAGHANFTFVTVKDSGHMVPQYQPERALEFFRRWLHGGSY